jgi:hypothetical protein
MKPYDYFLRLKYIEHISYLIGWLKDEKKLDEPVTDLGLSTTMRELILYDLRGREKMFAEYARLPEHIIKLETMIKENRLTEAINEIKTMQTRIMAGGDQVDYN